MPTTATYSYRTIKTLERMAEHLGFEVSDNMPSAYSKDENLSLIPKDEKLPIYTRNVVLARGSAEELISFLQGWMKMKEYFFNESGKMYFSKIKKFNRNKLKKKKRKRIKKIKKIKKINKTMIFWVNYEILSLIIFLSFLVNTKYNKDSY